MRTTDDDPPDWWLASDGRWYPPELHPDTAVTRTPAPTAEASAPPAQLEPEPEATRASPRPSRRHIALILAVSIAVFSLIANVALALGLSSTRHDLHALQATPPRRRPSTTIPAPWKSVATQPTVVTCFNQGWWKTWLHGGWLTSRRKPVANRDLWDPLIEAYRAHGGEMGFVWVKAHDSGRWNDVADRLAVRATRDRRGFSADRAPDM